MKAFIKETTDRVKAETPLYFRRFIYAGLSIGGLGGSLKLATTVPDVHLPAIITAHIGHMITAGVVAAAVAKCAKVDISKASNDGTTPPQQ